MHVYREEEISLIRMKYTIADGDFDIEIDRAETDEHLPSSRAEDIAK